MCGISWQPRESHIAPRASAVRKIDHADGERTAWSFAPDQSTTDCDAFAGRVPTRLGARVSSHDELTTLVSDASARSSYCQLARSVSVAMCDTKPASFVFILEDMCWKSLNPVRMLGWTYRDISASASPSGHLFPLYIDLPHSALSAY